jgi:membrane protein YdbS with pleckstrin-like domain
MMTAHTAKTWHGLVLDEGEAIVAEYGPSFRGNALNYLIFFVGMVVILGGEATAGLAAVTFTVVLVHYGLHQQTRWAVSSKRLLERPGLFKQARSVDHRSIRALEIKRPPLASLFATAQLVVTVKGAGHPLLLWRQANPDEVHATLQGAMQGARPRPKPRRSP